MIDLTGRHVFIVGGSRGIGAAAARMAAKAGARVSVNYVSNADAANRVVAEIHDLGGQAYAFQADAAEDGALDTAMREAVARLGPLNAIVVSAGIFEGMPIEEMTAEFWDRVMDINVKGTFLAVRAAVPHLKSNPAGGSIVIYTSTAGQRGSAVYSAYATSKAAQIMFMRSMALELADHRIRVNCIAPAWTETEMATEKIDAIGRESVVKGFPLGRIGLPEDIAGATIFLLSDLANFVTGSTITVDGGMDMRG
jgi:NAD(P)-dependent dehydrogenase (short-subunit alcohol dehydrogenase family)